MRLALGTAQFGLNYGISNKTGQVVLNEIQEILSLARSEGVDTIDTGMAYGNSEALLGEAGVMGFKVITKLPTIPDLKKKDIADWVRKKIINSISNLKTNSIYGVLLHDTTQLNSKNAGIAFNILAEMKSEGLIQKSGISIYSPDVIDTIFDNFKLDILQAPLNLVDRRLLTSGVLKKLYENGVEVHIRSAFLQGLMLLPFNEIPPYFSKWDSIWEHWHKWLDKTKIQAPAACLGYLSHFSEISRIIVGVENHGQFKELIDYYRLYEFLNLNYPDLSCSDEELINPSCWKTA